MQPFSADLFDFSDDDWTLPFVRAELIRHAADGPIRLLTADEFEHSRMSLHAPCSTT
jgi:hypothetical protein